VIPPTPAPAPSEIKIEPKQEEVKLTPIPIPIIIPKKNSVKELLIKAKNAIQFKKRKKLDKVMAMFLKKSKITNDEVEKYLHVSDATATRYLSELEKEGKIKQSGKTGKGVSYSRI
jgi:predicted HTH transcriptional regulator